MGESVSIDVNKATENMNILKQPLLSKDDSHISDLRYEARKVYGNTTADGRSPDYNSDADAIDTSHLMDPSEDDFRGDQLTMKEEILLLVRKVGGEAIASFMVIVTLLAVKVNTYGNGVLATLCTALIGGLVVMLTIFSLGHVSGSHINPAVTIAYTATRNFPLPLAPLYISAHLIGATLAALVIEVVFQPAQGIVLVTPNATVLQSLLAEILGGFLLLFVASSVSTDIRAIGEFAGLAVGAIIAVDIMVVGPVSGGGINPARALGPAFVSRDFQNVWIYIVGPIAGGLLGASAYRLLRPEEVRKPSAHKLSITSTTREIRRSFRVLRRCSTS